MLISEKTKENRKRRKCKHTTLVQVNMFFHTSSVLAFDLSIPTDPNLRSVIYKQNMLCSYNRRTADHPEGSLVETTENVAMDPNPVYNALSNERQREIQLEPNPVYSMHTQTRADTHNLAPGEDPEYDYISV